ncbi:MAG: aldehyde dehydrogenase [Amylibacter sp.]|nr:aldehyde dehydrogenase [Amylibacter sp.]
MKFQLYIDGAFCDGAKGGRIECVNPGDEQVWNSVPEATEADVDRAVDAAHRAFSEGPWAQMSPAARGKCLYRLGDLLEKHAAEFAEVESRDSGKILRETAAQCRYMADYLRFYAGLADKVTGQTLAHDKPDMICMTIREPLGVVAAVVPWNSQIFLTCVKLGPALAMGNTIVIKASEDAPCPVLKFAELVDKAGFPAGVVNIIAGYGPTCGARLTSHPKVARVAFTGGVEAARNVVRNTADNFALLTLELGGKAPVLVFDDANLESAANGVVAGVFAAAGQSCVSGSRLLVQEGVRDEFLAMLVKKAQAIKIGDPVDKATEMGPLCTRRQRDRIQELLVKSVANGAEILTGGNIPEGFDKGNYFEPTIVLCEADGLAVYEEELFGPVLSVRSFKTEDQAVALANASRFHYAGGAFTRDLARGMRLTRTLAGGVTYINTWRVISPSAPFGGNKDTGYGRESGMDTMLDYSRTRTVWINTSDAPMADPFVMR